MSDGESHRWPVGADAMKEMMAYYEQRAPVYDSTVNEKAASEARALLDVLAALPPASTLDVGCGTGFLTSRLPGEVVGLDQSAAMVAQARRKVPHAQFVRGDALRLPFGAAAFRRVTAGFLYGHLLPAERSAFLAEARCVAAELVVVEPAADRAQSAEGWERRTLPDGRIYSIYSRRFTPQEMLGEVGRGEVLFAGKWFVAVIAEGSRQSPERD